MVGRKARKKVIEQRRSPNSWGTTRIGGRPPSLSTTRALGEGWFSSYL